MKGAITFQALGNHMNMIRHLDDISREIARSTSQTFRADLSTVIEI